MDFVLSTREAFFRAMAPPFCSDAQAKSAARVMEALNLWLQARANYAEFNLALAKRVIACAPLHGGSTGGLVEKSSASNPYVLTHVSENCLNHLRTEETVLHESSARTIKRLQELELELWKRYQAELEAFRGSHPCCGANLEALCEQHMDARLALIC